MHMFAGIADFLCRICRRASFERRNNGGLLRNKPSLRAKRSNPSRGKTSVDCFVASLLAMTVA
jgi:hypothetical protein